MDDGFRINKVTTNQICHVCRKGTLIAKTTTRVRSKQSLWARLRRKKGEGYKETSFYCDRCGVCLEHLPPNAVETTAPIPEAVNPDLQTQSSQIIH